MNNEEAIKILQDARNMLVKANEIYGMHDFEKAKDAYDLAIEALAKEEKRKLYEIPDSEKPDINSKALIMMIKQFDFKEEEKIIDVIERFDELMAHSEGYGSNGNQAEIKRRNKK